MVATSGEKNGSGAGPLPLGTLAWDLASGTVVTIISVAYCISFAALIFSGALAPGLSLGLNAILLGTGLTGSLIALTTSLPRAVGGPDTPAIAVFSALAISVAAALPAGMAPEAATYVVIVAIGAATLVTGILLLGLGLLRLGSVVRFVPYSVVAGFLAASGCLLIAGAFRVATGSVLSWTALAEAVLPSSAASAKLLFALLFAAAVFTIRLRYRHFVVLPACVLLGFLLLHGLFSLGWNGEAAARADWFLAFPSGSGLVLPLAEPDRLASAATYLIDGSGEIVAVAVVTAMAVILNTSGLEAVWKTNSNLEREFRINGLANLLSGALGGIAGNVSLNRSILNRECGAVGRLSALVPALACLALLFLGRDLLGAVPTPLLAGLLLFLGLSIVINSLGWASFRRDWRELLLILLITGLILFVGYLEGLFVGLVGACLLFAYTYSRVDIVKQEFTRAERSSNVERAPAQSRFLADQGERVRVVTLHGYLFFATSNRLVEDLKRRFHDPAGPRMAYLIIGFRLVSGLDISTVLSFAKLRNACEESGIKLALCGLSPALTGLLEESRQPIIDGEVVRLFPSLHEALEWAEEEILRQPGAPQVATDEAERFEAWLGSQVGDCSVEAGILPYLERLAFPRNAQLVAQGAESDSIDLVVSGRIGVQLERPDGLPVRLRSMLGHTVFGEMGFYRGTPRTASVIAEADTVIYRLSREAFQRMARENPEAAAAFHQFIVRVLADRLSFANTEIAILDL